MAGEQFSLVWNSFPTNLSSGLYSLLTDEHLVDVTLAAEGKILRAHKLILSVCSSYFRDLFKGNTCKHPIVILKDVNYRDLSAMLHFMYQGEVHIKQEDIASFLKVAETLQIKGLTRDANQKRDKPEEESSGAERLEETIKSEKEYEDDHEVEEQEEEEEEEEIQVDEENDEKEVEKVEQMEQQHSLNLPSDNLSTRDDNTDDIASSSSLTTLQNDNNLKNDTNIQALPSSIFMDTEQQLQNTITQPLNCTSENIDQDITDDNDKPLDYRFGVTQSTSLSISNTTTKKQIQSPTESSSYHSDYQEESPEINQGENRLDDAAFRTRAAKGRRTVKGIPHSTLPLETTLRVVSELGPTLRVDRGKVVRMYSCPWCLRHFTRKENLKLHVRYIHGPLESLTCKLCGNKYKNSNSLRVHSYLYHNTKRNKHNNSLVGSNT